MRMLFETVVQQSESTFSINTNQIYVTFVGYSTPNPHKTTSFHTFGEHLWFLSLIVPVELQPNRTVQVKLFFVREDNIFSVYCYPMYFSLSKFKLIFLRIFVWQTACLYLTYFMCGVLKNTRYTVRTSPFSFIVSLTVLADS